jgi:hypothetical protein
LLLPSRQLEFLTDESESDMADVLRKVTAVTAEIATFAALNWIAAQAFRRQRYALQARGLATG